MKTYVIITGTIFGLITLAHLWRIFAENPKLGTDPWFILLTIFTAALSLWAAYLLRKWPAGNR